MGCWGHFSRVQGLDSCIETTHIYSSSQTDTNTFIIASAYSAVAGMASSMSEKAGELFESAKEVVSDAANDSTVQSAEKKASGTYNSFL